MSNEWTFGWNQLLTIAGFIITVCIAVSGFRTFNRWKREKIEERRIEIAFDALSLAHESKAVFEAVRNGLAYEIEWKDMPVKDGEGEDDRALRGSYYAILRRLLEHQKFFDRVWTLQPKVMALFGEEAEAVFGLLHDARAAVLVSAQTLTWELPARPKVPSEEDFKHREELRAYLWGNAQGDDRVSLNLVNFRKGIERLCRPVIDRTFKERWVTALRA